MTLLEQGQLKNAGSTEQSMSSTQLNQLANHLDKVEKTQQGGAVSGQQASGQNVGNWNIGRRQGNWHPKALEE